MGVRVTKDTLTYTGGAFVGFVLALVNVAVVTRFLSPSEFGQLALLLTFAAFLTVFYNLGTLQGIFMWVFGSSGEEEVDDTEQASAGSKRKALGTGIIFTATIGLIGTALVAAVAPQLADLVLGDSSKAHLILIAAASGAAGALWRLVANILRMERSRAGTWCSTPSGPILVTGSVIPLVAAGGGVEAAIVGTTVGSWISVGARDVGDARSYVLAVERGDMIQFIRRGAVYVPIILSFWVAQNVDLFALSKFAPTSRSGSTGWRAGSGSFVSYFSSALFMAWTPLRSTSIFMAAEREHGQESLGGTFLSYFVLGGTLLVLAVTVGADTLVRISPPSYADAAPLIPVVAAGLPRARAARRSLPRHHVPAKAVHLWLLRDRCRRGLPGHGPAADPVARRLWRRALGDLGFLASASILGIVSQRGPSPLPIEYRRIAAGIAIAAACLIVGKGLGALAGPGTRRRDRGLDAVSGIARGHRHRPGGGDEVDLGGDPAAVLSRPRDSTSRPGSAPSPPTTSPYCEEGWRSNGGWRRWRQARTRTRPSSATELVRLPRRLDGSESHRAGPAIGAYLFADVSVAETMRWRAISGAIDVEPSDVHRLERILAELARIPDRVWEEYAASVRPEAPSERSARRTWLHWPGGRGRRS